MPAAVRVKAGLPGTENGEVRGEGGEASMKVVRSAGPRRAGPLLVCWPSKISLPQPDAPKDSSRASALRPFDSRREGESRLPFRIFRLSLTDLSETSQALTNPRKPSLPYPIVSLRPLARSIPCVKLTRSQITSLQLPSSSLQIPHYVRYRFVI